MAHHESLAGQFGQSGAQGGVVGGRGQEAEGVGVAVLGGLVEEVAVLDAARSLDQPGQPSS
ncbi:hypothetical protein [Streptomyces litmocidini]|uniref:hypothetical protein n=1 Tax=Streptomyces litmocidini TaxID=67318 RepID=UPI00167D860E|nr:hypothetical protein [Streptomyces litmocidini]